MRAVALAMVLGGCWTAPPPATPLSNSPPPSLGVIEGHVTGDNNAALAGVKVWATAAGRGAVRTATVVSDKAGAYRLTGLRPATYSVSFENGPQTRRTDVTVDARAPQVLDISFDLGADVPPCNAETSEDMTPCVP